MSDHHSPTNKVKKRLTKTILNVWNCSKMVSLALVSFWREMLQLQVWNWWQFDGIVCWPFKKEDEDLEHNNWCVRGWLMRCVRKVVVEWPISNLNSNSTYHTWELCCSAVLTLSTMSPCLEELLVLPLLLLHLFFLSATLPSMPLCLKGTLMMTWKT